ncbi:MAG: SagB/ThcOx family dehydrogenase [Thermoanaerobaculia bacterium]
MARSDRRTMQQLTQSAGKDPLYEVFHENTKLGPLTSRAYSAWIVNFTRSHTAQQTIDQAYKVYTLMERQELPPVEARNELERAIAERRSVRRFSGEPLSREELARLLFFTYGKTDRQGPFRAVASGGALYPLELYVAALRVDGIAPGIYHYSVETGGLDLVRPGNPLATLKQVLAWEGVDIDNAALALVMTAAFRRNTVKYRDRGYRLILLEAGEAAQNFALLATSLGLGSCLLGGFHDDLLSELLDVDGVEEAPLLPVLVGRPVPAGGS